jgi:tetratricopeptide (TPR) repeat protein
MILKKFILNNKYSIIIFLITFLFYGNTIKNNYSFSDSYVINTQTEKGISAIPEIFTTRYFTENKINYGYRPISKTTFAIESSVFGRNPHISHFINVLFYAILIFLIFNTLKLIFNNLKDEYLFIAVLLFMAHPAQTEVVASLKNREEILMFFFGMLTIRYIFKFVIENKWYYILFAAISLVIGYYSKPTVTIIIATVPFFLFFSKKINLKQGIFLFLILLVIIYLTKKLPSFFLDRGSREMLFQENPLVDANFYTRLGTGFNVMFFYIKKLILPYPLSFYYGYNTITITKLLSLSSILSFLFFAIIGVFALLKSKSRNILYFGILSLIGTIFLYSNMITKDVAGIVADRYMFIPSLFFSLIIVYFIFKFFKEDVNKNTYTLINKNIYYVITIILISYFIIDYNRNAQWDTASTLIQHDIKHLQNSAMANEIYATNRYEIINTLKTNEEKIKALEKSIKHYEISLQIYPKYKFSLNSLGNIYFMFYKDYSKSADYYEKYLKLDSNNFTIIKNTGFCYEKLKDYNKSLYFYNKAYKLKPNDLKLNSLIANKYYYLGNKEKGDFYNNNIKGLNPQSEIPDINLGNYFFVLKDTLMAVKSYEKALKRNPNNRELKLLLNNYYKFKFNKVH